MKPVWRTKSRTQPIAEPVPTATTGAVAATATAAAGWCAPRRFRTSSQSGEPDMAGSRRSRLMRSGSVTFVPPPVGCVARRARVEGRGGGPCRDPERLADRCVVEVCVLAEEDGCPLPLRQTRERHAQLGVILWSTVRETDSS